MKKILIVVAAILILSPLMVVGVDRYATVINDAGNKKVVVVGSKIPEGYKLMTSIKFGGSMDGNPAYLRDVVGSSAAAVMGGTTKILTTGLDYDKVFLNIKITPATTSAQIYAITPYYSTTPNCSASTTDPSIDWYAQTLQTASGLNSTSTLPYVYSFGSSATSSQMFQIKLTDVGAACIKFVTTSSHASTTAWIRALVKSN